MGFNLLQVRNHSLDDWIGGVADGIGGVVGIGGFADGIGGVGSIGNVAHSISVDVHTGFPKVGAWNWPMRGKRIGEAANPGPDVGGADSSGPNSAQPPEIEIDPGAFLVDLLGPQGAQ